jgi:hypothetical protein
MATGVLLAIVFVHPSMWVLFFGQVAIKVGSAVFAACGQGARPFRFIYFLPFSPFPTSHSLSPHPLLTFFFSFLLPFLHDISKIYAARPWDMQ